MVPVMSGSGRIPLSPLFRSTMQELSPDALSERLRDDDEGTLVLDVRHETAFEEWHVPGSVNVDVYDELTEDLGEVKSRNADLARDRESFVAALASDVPDHPPNFERVKRTNVGQESVPADELAELELGPNNCAAE